MQLGLPWWIGAGEPGEGIRLAAETGYDFVELSLDAPWPEGLDPLALADEAEDAGIALGFHGPWRTQSLAHPREALARGAREVAQSCVQAARSAEAEYVVFHVDARGFRGYPRETVVEAGLETAHASLQALARSAGEELDLLVENTTSPMGTPAELADFLEAVPDVGFCLDPGHAAIQAHHDETTWTVADWRDALAQRWQLTHLMDVLETEGRVHDHLLPGAGEADIDSILEAAREAGAEWTLVEAFRADVEGTEIRKGDWREGRKVLEEL